MLHFLPCIQNVEARRTANWRWTKKQKKEKQNRTNKKKGAGLKVTYASPPSHFIRICMLEPIWAVICLVYQMVCDGNPDHVRVKILIMHESGTPPCTTGHLVTCVHRVMITHAFPIPYLGTINNEQTQDLFEICHDGTIRDKPKKKSASPGVTRPSRLSPPGITPLRP